MLLWWRVQFFVVKKKRNERKKRNKGFFYCLFFAVHIYFLSRVVEKEWWIWREKLFIAVNNIFSLSVYLCICEHFCLSHFTSAILFNWSDVSKVFFLSNKKSEWGWGIVNYINSSSLSDIQQSQPTEKNHISSHP